MTSTDKITIQRAFNSHFIELLEDIVRIYPENAEMLFAKTSFEQLKRMNPTAIIKAWYNRIYIRYKDELDAGNLDFFFEKDYQSDVSGKGDILQIIDSVRGPLQHMSEENRKHTISYLHNLCKLSSLYAEF